MCPGVADWGGGVHVVVECVCYNMSGHHWKRGQWTKDEVDRLQANIASYCRVFANLTLICHKSLLIRHLMRVFCCLIQQSFLDVN